MTMTQDDASEVEKRVEGILRRKQRNATDSNWIDASGVSSEIQYYSPIHSAARRCGLLAEAWMMAGRCRG